MIFKTGDIFREKYSVSEEVYTNFIKFSHDENPLHTNESFAKSKGFSGVVMQGNILNGFISYFIGNKLPTLDVIIHSQTIQYMHPVYLDDVLQFEANIVGVYESVKAVEFKFFFRNEEAKIVAKGKIQIGLIQ